MRVFLKMSILTALLAVVALPALSEDKKKPRDPIDEQKNIHLRRLEKLRGLKFETDPEIKYWDEAKLKKMMVEEFDTELPEKRARSMQLTLAKLGLVPMEWELRKEYLALMMEQVAGFYHPKTKALCLIEGKSAGAEEDMVIIHELDHAMQDQHFDLLRLTKLVEKNDDMTHAFKSLVEGEATFIMLEHVMRLQSGDEMGAEDIPMLDAMLGQALGAGGPGAKKLSEAPLIIREGLVRTYIDGMKWCVAIKKAKGWEGLNAAWTDLPASSEQILHPEKYLERDMPQKVALATPAGLQEWKMLEENSLGEFGVTALFLTLKPKSPKSGKEAAEGWDGDWYRVYEKGEETLLAWGTTWDSELDAREFAIAYTKLLKSKYEGLDDVKADANPFVAGSKGGAVAVKMDGRHVYVVEGGTEDEAGATMESLVEGTKFSEMKTGIGKK